MFKPSDASIHFIADEEASAFFDTHQPSSVDWESYRFVNSTWAWVVQTALHLRYCGFRVSMSGSFRPDAINVGTASTLRKMSRTPDFFRLSLDADQLRVRWANLHVVQNKNQCGRRAFWIPHWTQPGLIERAGEWSQALRVAFFGLEKNLTHDVDWWRRICGRYEMEFVIKPKSEWHDYSDVDVAIGIRRFGSQRFDDKPPTKLFNAWMGRVVFVGGSDSAYEQVGHPGVNYFRVCSEQELDNTLRLLSSRPDVCREIVAAGTARLNECGARESTQQRWVDLFLDQVFTTYFEWRESATWKRKIETAQGVFLDEALVTRNNLWKSLKSRAKRLGG